MRMEGYLFKNGMGIAIYFTTWCVNERGEGYFRLNNLILLAIELPVLQIHFFENTEMFITQI